MHFNNKKIIKLKKTIDVYVVTIRTVSETTEKDEDEDEDDERNEDSEDSSDDRDYHEFVLELHPSPKVDITKEEIVQEPVYEDEDDDNLENGELIQAREPKIKNLTKVVHESELKKHLERGWKRGKNPVREEIMAEIILGLEMISHKRPRTYEKLPYFKRYFKDSWYTNEENILDTYVGYKLTYYDTDGQKYNVTPKLDDADLEFINKTVRKTR